MANEHLEHAGHVEISNIELEELVRGGDVETCAVDNDANIARRVTVAAPGNVGEDRPPILLSERFDAMDTPGRSGSDVLADVRSFFMQGEEIWNSPPNDPRLGPDVVERARAFAMVVVVESESPDAAHEDLGAALPQPGVGGRTFALYGSEPVEVDIADGYTTDATIDYRDSGRVSLVVQAVEDDAVDASLRSISDEEVAERFAELLLAAANDHGAPIFAGELAASGAQPGALRVMAGRWRDGDFIPAVFADALEVLADQMED